MFVTGKLINTPPQKYPYLGGACILNESCMTGWLMSTDVNSEYPSTIMSNNIGFDTKVNLENLPNDFKNYIFSMQNKFNVYDKMGQYVINSENAKIHFKKNNGEWYNIFVDSKTGKTHKEKVSGKLLIFKNDRNEYIYIDKDDVYVNEIKFEIEKEYFNILYRKPQDPLYTDILFSTVNLFVERKFDFKDYLKKYNLSVTPNMVFYKKDKMSIMNMIMRLLYKTRIKHKANYKEAISKIKINDKSKNWNEIAIQAKTLDQTFKLLLNKGYGVFASVFFKYFDLDIANSITATAQYYIRSTHIPINYHFNNIFKTKNETYVKYTDTDSNYVLIEPFIQKMYNKKMYDNKDDLIEDVLKFNERVMQPILNKSFENSTNYLNSYDNKMVMKVEKIMDNGIFSAKKKYLLRVIWDEGTYYKPYEYKAVGMQTKNVNYPKFIKDSINNALEYIFKRDIVGLNKFIDKTKETFKKLPLYEIGQNVYVRKFDDYIVKYKNFKEITAYYDSKTLNNLFKSEKLLKNGNYIIINRATKIIKGAAFSNFLIEKHNLNIPLFVNGSAANLIYLKSGLNNYGIGDSILVNKNTNDLVELIKDYVDYDLQFYSFFIKPIHSLLRPGGLSLDVVKQKKSIFSF